MKLAILSITLIFPFVLVIEKGWSYESTEKVSKYKNHCNILDGNYKITDKLVKIEYQTVSKAPLS